MSQLKVQQTVQLFDDDGANVSRVQGTATVDGNGFLITEYEVSAMAASEAVSLGALAAVRALVVEAEADLILEIGAGPEEVLIEANVPYSVTFGVGGEATIAFSSSQATDTPVKLWMIGV